MDLVPLPLPPSLPADLAGHLDGLQWQDHDVTEVDVPDELAARMSDPETGEELAAVWRAARAARDKWLRQVERGRPQRQLFEQLLEVAGRLATRDDEFELVLCSGLVAGTAESGRRVYRHLLVKRMFARIGDGHSRVTVGPVEEAALTMEDRRFLAPVLGDRLGRADDIRAEIENSDLLPSGEGAGKWLADWSERLLPDAPRYRETAEPPPSDRVERLSVSASPALVFRRRDRSSVAAFLEDVLEKLRDVHTPVPQALVQILHDLTPEEQEEWATAAGNSKRLGDNPLFVKPYNREQRLVLDRVRLDNGAVVQGPPGTGKTHTIANLLVAMLAEGLRVLVVSQREQPLGVLRGMLPPELRSMCVSLAGGKRGRMSELEACVRALSEYLASTTETQAEARVETCREQWNLARARLLAAESDLAALRESEYTEHPPVAPGYQGRLADIASSVRAGRDRFGWLPQLPASAPAACPLLPVELAELRGLLEAHPEGPCRADQSVPPPEEVHSPKQIAQLFKSLELPSAVPQVQEIADRCAAVDPAELDRWLADLGRLAEIVRHLDQRAGAKTERWLQGAVSDMLSGNNLNAWRELINRAPAAEQLSSRSRNPVLRDVRHDETDPAVIRDLRDEARILLRGLQHQRPFRTRIFRHLTDFGKETALVRQKCSYRQRELRTAESAAAVYDVLDILTTLTDLEHAWSFVVWLESPAPDPTNRLRWLAAAEAALPMLAELGNIAVGLRSSLAENRILALLTTRESWFAFRDGAHLARRRMEVAEHEKYHGQLLAWWEYIAAAEDAAPESGRIAAALRARDIDAFRVAAEAVGQARTTIYRHRRLRDLCEQLQEGHPDFMSVLKESSQNEAWEERFAVVGDAWNWAVAERFVRDQHRPGLDAMREADLAAAKESLRAAAEELAIAQAWSSCLSTMDPSARRALRSYSHFAQRQGGRGKPAARNQRSARSAIVDAKSAVPAWVMTIDEAADLFPAEQNSFDVVIVDEASQAEPTSLFLLWLAQRVIVVGDDKQCSPFSSQRGLEPVIARLKAEFPNVPDHVREILLPHGNLYDILSTAFPSVVRLREHFRCMPEIISWSSKEFYNDDLVPLRQHGTDRLEPVQIRFVPDGQTTGSSETLTNRAEAAYVVDLLADCLEDPAYEGKSFGVIAMQSAKQVKVLDQLIRKRMLASEIEARDIRVGVAQSFQGDERDVMLVSTVAAGRTQTIRNDPRYDRRLNVAVSRARDQLILVTSLGESLDGEDIRRRMLSHYQELESPSPDLLDITGVSPAQLATPFRSLFVQQVYLAVRGRGYDAEPHVDIGGRPLDIVVRGRVRSVVIMCDEYRGLKTERRRRDDESLRELSRAGWPFCRVVHSQFVLDPEEALDVVWEALNAEKIELAEA
ncbi:AAA domain-containing protein [Amycolatopsis sp. WGS_07]|uniref:AAA domain-containing protein n=1 Tax=Amycolatopsis sp. WGS_07 TaxID=3076764 RepID=UPI003873B991